MSGGAGQVVPTPSNNSTYIEQPEPSESSDASDFLNQKINRGGAVKPSDILGGISAVSGAASAIPGAAIITAPIAAIAGLASSIAKLFGGRLTHKELEMLGHIKNRVDHRKNIGLD